MHFFAQIAQPLDESPFDGGMHVFISRGDRKRAALGISDDLHQFRAQRRQFVLFEYAGLGEHRGMCHRPDAIPLDQRRIQPPVVPSRIRLEHVIDFVSLVPELLGHKFVSWLLPGVFRGDD